MKFIDRIKGIEGINDAYWESRRNRLVVYYPAAIALDTMKIRFAGAIDEASLHNAIEEITLISVTS